MNQITGLGYGIVVFALVIGVGSVILFNFGNASAQCATLYPLNTTTGLCDAGNGTTATPSGTGYTTITYMTGQLGQSGLAGWVPAIIAISVGLLFLGAFMIGKEGNKGRY